MAALFGKLHRHRIEKRKLIINLINSSDCWTGINDLRPKYGTLSPRHHLKMKSDFWQQKSPTTIGQNNSFLKNSSRRLYHKWSALVQKLMVE